MGTFYIISDRTFLPYTVFSLDLVLFINPGPSDLLPVPLNDSITHRLQGYTGIRDGGKNKSTSNAKVTQTWITLGKF